MEKKFTQTVSRGTKRSVDPAQKIKEIAIRLTEEPVIIKESSIPRKPLMDLLAEHLHTHELDAIWTDQVGSSDLLKSETAHEMRMLDTHITYGAKITGAEKQAATAYKNSLERYRVFEKTRELVREIASPTQKSGEAKLWQEIFSSRPGDTLSRILPHCINRLDSVILNEEAELEMMGSKIKPLLKGLEQCFEAGFFPDSHEAAIKMGREAAVPFEKQASAMLDEAERIFHHKSVIRLAETAINEFEELGKLLAKAHYR